MVIPTCTRPVSNTSLQIQQSLPPGVSLVAADDFKEWQMDIKVLDPNPIYLDQTYRLRFRFSNNYPIGAHPFPSRLYPTLHFISYTLPVPFHPTTRSDSHPYRSTRSNLCRTLRPRTPNTYASPHLLQRHHLPGSFRQPGLVACTECGERLYEHSKYVDGQYEK